MPIPPTMSLLSALALRDEWGSVQQFLSLADLGCLRAVSHELRATITPQALDQAAMKLIREQESPASRRFVATTTWVGQGESLVRCYDRTQDCLCVDALLADCRATQVSVANDGKVFVGTPLGGHVIAAGGDVQVYPDPPAANGERLAGTVFRLSPDERFLIRPGPHSGSLLLEDLRDGRHVILPRMEPLRPGQQCLKPASIAFSVLNALAAVAYQDGLILVFDLLHEDVHGACQLTRAELRCPGWLEGLSIRMDGFDRVQTIFAYRSDAELPLGRHTLCLGRA